MYGIRKHVFILCSLIIWTGCADGELDTKVNYYHHQYGLNIAPCDDCRHIVGKVVMPDQSLAVNARVYIENTSTLTLTNEKGAFHLPGVTQEKITIIILSGEFIGTRLEINNEDTLVELKKIQLKPLLGVTGQIIADSISVMQTKVGIDGTPFQSEVNAQGGFQLWLPKGNYKIMARNILYEPGELAVEVQKNDAGIQNLKIFLEPVHFPTASVQVDTPGGFIVRGDTVFLKIDVPENVKLMRMRDLSPSSIDNSDAGPWFNVSKRMRLKVMIDRYHQFEFIFSDLFGRMTEPQLVSFYSTSVGEDWKIIYTAQNQPVHIKKGEKVLLLDRILFGSNSESDEDTSSGISQNEKRQPGPLVFRPVRNGLQSILGASFDSSVYIEEGATLVGSARFYGDVVANGSAGAPIDWNMSAFRDQDLYAETPVNYFGAESSRFQHVNFRSGVLASRDNPLSATKMQMENISLDLSTLMVMSEGWGGKVMEIELRKLKITNSNVEIFCPSLIAQIPPPDRKDSMIKLRLSQSDIDNTYFSLFCDIQESVTGALVLDLQENNFFRASEKEGVYFNGLPIDGSIEYQVGANYFAEPKKLYTDISQDDPPYWPHYFGTLQTTPFTRE